MLLNESAFPLAESLIAAADRMGVAVHEVGGVRVVDCGVARPGSTDAGLAMAMVAMAGRGEVRLLDAGGGFGPAWPDCPWPVVTATSDEPVAACLAAQYAGWKVSDSSWPACSTSRPSSCGI